MWRRAETSAADEDVLRATLLATARRVFTEHGYADTSMDDFTAQAKLTRGALQGERMSLSPMKEDKLSNNQRVNVLHRK
ncbi:TetR/AcrR family transcriptional regulator [Klebsiella sp. D-Nf1]|nr:TetR/AcrR family transcriptional regulator [Klebsiella sp. C-Nf10]PJX55014.1 TetR/AcrR family transcriptional regulator [Klebsiella sp. D-Nf1]